jgi:chromosome segregation ATPase
MDKDAVRKHIFEEVHSQFESKLREAKRQKSQAEEELESLSEKWRSERRRLNSEIDRLESALSETRESRAKSGSFKQGRGVDPEELTKLRTASEETLKQATAEWDGERTKLRSEITRLQITVAELIERSNNPLRANQGLKEDLDSRQKRKDDEQQGAKAAWEKEKSRLTAEIDELRRAAGDKNAERLEKQLEETARARDNAERDLQDVRQESETAQRTLRNEIAALQEELAQSKRRADAGSSAAEELRQTRETARVQRSQESEERARLSSQLEQARTENSRMRASHETDLQKARAEVDALQKQFTSEIADLRAALKRADQQAAAQASDNGKLDELAKQRDLLQQQLLKANELVRSIRSQHADEHAKLTAQLEASRAEVTRIHKDMELKLGKAASDAESQKQKAAAEISALRENSRRTGKQTEGDAGMSSQLQEAMQQKNFLQQQLHQANDAVRAIRAEESRKYADLSAQLEESRTQIRHLEQRLNGSKGSVDSEVVEQLRKQYDSRMQEMIQQKTKLTEELQKASSMLEAERSRFATAAATAAPATDKATKLDASKINEEVARVEGLLRGITALIDDPSTELSTVIRKNVERAEWDAYLKGILFSMGRGKKK